MTNAELNSAFKRRVQLSLAKPIQPIFSRMGHYRRSDGELVNAEFNSTFTMKVNAEFNSTFTMEVNAE
jgi:hypothetical protein